jgi:hypothetical protein
VNLKLKRLVRTPHSEQYALFDLDQPDADGAPRTIGKLDLHYTAEGMYGTLLLWDASMRTLRPRTRRTFVHALLREIAQPMGVPNEYVVEFFAPTLDQYEVFHNVEVESEDATPSAADDVDLLAEDDLAFDDLDESDADDATGDGDDFESGDETLLEPPPSLSEPPPVRRFAPRSSDTA